ncbi:hypothetical protein JCM8208_005406 [Rhodotorula glutinis]
MPTKTRAPLPVSPGPWTLNGEAWIFIIRDQPFSETPVPLPEGNYAPLEKGSEGDLSHRFHGGTGLFLVIRYSNTPVGPYDEVMIVPGLFSYKVKGRKDKLYRWAITRLHTADFTFTDLADGTQQVTIQHPVPGATPFFRCRLQHSRLTPFQFPVSTQWLETRLAKTLLVRHYEIELIQPPCPAAEGDDDPRIAPEGQRAEALKQGTGYRRVLHPASGWGKACKLLPAPPAVGEPGHGQDWSGFGDGKSFPKFKGPYLEHLNVHLLTFDMLVPLAELIDVEDE